MTTSRVHERQAAAFLAARSVMANLMKRTGPSTCAAVRGTLPRSPRVSCTSSWPAPRSCDPPTLCRAVRRRSPRSRLSRPAQKASSSGLSGRKVVSMRDLAAKWLMEPFATSLGGSPTRRSSLASRSCEASDGGREMFLIFQLRRSTCGPSGIWHSQGYALAYGCGSS